MIVYDPSFWVFYPLFIYLFIIIIINAILLFFLGRIHHILFVRACQDNSIYPF